MNYLKLYDKFINYCKNTTPKKRLQKRNKFDLRLQNDYLYTEIHHIIPRSLGGDDNPDNLIELLPEEHLFIHQLRWKIFGHREDMLAVRFILNGLKGIKNEEIEKALNSKILNKKILKGYAWLKQNIQEFRKKHQWHTEEGLKRISEAQKNKIIVKDAKTGKLIGKVNCDHPKVLSGEWVHHTKNTKMVFDLIENKAKRISFEEFNKNSKRYISLLKYKEISKGFNNPKAKKISGEEIINKFKEYLDYINNNDKNEFSIPNFLKWLCENYKICFKGHPFKKFRFSDLQCIKKNCNRKEILFYLLKKINKENEYEYYLKLQNAKSKKHIEKIRQKIKENKC